MRFKDPARRRSAALALALWAPLLSGCWAWARVDGGVTTPTTLCEGCQGATVNTHFAAGEDGEAGFDTAIRMKFTPDVAQFAYGVGYVGTFQPEPVSPYFLGGAHLLQLESAFDEFAIGAFSPYAELGARIALSDRRGGLVELSLGTSIEYDLRFTDQPNQGFWGFMIGVGVSDD